MKLTMYILLVMYNILSGLLMTVFYIRQQRIENNGRCVTSFMDIVFIVACYISGSMIFILVLLTPLIGFIIERIFLKKKEYKLIDYIYVTYKIVIYMVFYGKEYSYKDYEEKENKKCLKE
jgi:hypothetical protein